MSVSPSFRGFVLEQLGRVLPAVRGRSMFGGVGVYSGDRFFALVDDDVLYFKVNESSRGEFEQRGMEPFRPAGPGGEVMQYYEVPADVLEDVEALRTWASRAVAAAAAARRRRKASRS
jgi:DNA transformation protein